jgi:hypothetical protein
MHLTKETRDKIGLTIFGLTLFPAIVHGLKVLFITSPITMLSYYANFYRSLLDMGWDGMAAWGIACVPYMVYEIVLFVRSFFLRTDNLKDEELENENG